MRFVAERLSNLSLGESATSKSQYQKKPRPAIPVIKSTTGEEIFESQEAIRRYVEELELDEEEALEEMKKAAIACGNSAAKTSFEDAVNSVLNGECRGVFL